MAKFKKGNTFGFKPKHTPHNKGKGLEEYMPEESIKKIQETQFKPGQKAGEKNNTWKGGVQTPKNDCVHIYDGVGKRKRNPRVVYEQHFGAIPKGYVIYHLDGDHHNDDPNNLEAISRGELIKRNRQ